MKSIFTIIKSDYLQRTRSYAFLSTLCASLAIAYTFVPEPNANYSTIRIADYVGYYNSSWFGYVTAIMTSLFLSLIGFYLVNSGVKTDLDSKVGQIVATTRVSNFVYLLSKVMSNFLLLITIMATVFIMSMLLFFLYNDGYPFELIQFIKPYVLITVPALFLISVIAVVFEIFLGRYSVIQNVGFFFLFTAFIAFSPKTESEFAFDMFGTKIVMHQLEESVREITNTDMSADLSIGYVVPDEMKETKKFEFTGVDFPISFIISRFVWIVLGIGIIALISPLFHRFDIKERIRIKRSKIITTESSLINNINLLQLPKSQLNYSIFPLLKTEFLLLFKKGKKWLWLVNFLGMGLLGVLPLEMSHQLVLPILWFLQVSRLSDLTTKELTHNVHYFSFTAFKPLVRLLTSQVFAGVILMVILALPLLIRYGMVFNSTAIISVVLGSVFIIALSTCLGILSRGKKLFEVLFFMLTYANINGIPFADYFGGFEHQQYYLIKLAIIISILGSISFLTRMRELRR